MKKLHAYALIFPTASLHISNDLKSYALQTASFRLNIDVYDNHLKSLNTWICLNYSYVYNDTLGIGLYACQELAPREHYYDKALAFPYQYISKGEIVLKSAILNSTVYLPRKNKLTPYSFQNQTFNFFKNNLIKA